MRMAMPALSTLIELAGPPQELVESCPEEVPLADVERRIIELLKDGVEPWRSPPPLLNPRGHELLEPVPILPHAQLSALHHMSRSGVDAPNAKDKAPYSATAAIPQMRTSKPPSMDVTAGPIAMRIAAATTPTPSGGRSTRRT